MAGRTPVPGERLTITLILPAEELEEFLRDAREQERSAAAEIRYIVRRYFAEMREHA